MAGFFSFLTGRRPYGFIITASLLAGLDAEAGVIQVSMGDNAGPSLQGPAGGGGSIWNDWCSSETALMDSTGAITPVIFTAGGEGPHGDWWCDLRLLASGSHVDDGVSSPLVISGLEPLKTYDLHIASSWGNKGGSTTFRTVNPTNTASPQTADNRMTGNATTWVRGVNSVFFQDLAADGSGRIQLTYEGTGSYGILNGFQLIGPIEVPTSDFQTWAAAESQGLTPLSNAGPLDDPDGDGIVNELEFALGGMPMVSSLSILPKLTSVGGRWVFEYERNDAARPPNTQQVVEYGSDLFHWTPIVIPVISEGNVTIVDQGVTDRVRVILPASGGPMFARLRTVP